MERGGEVGSRGGRTRAGRVERGVDSHVGFRRRGAGIRAVEERGEGIGEEEEHRANVLGKSGN